MVKFERGNCPKYKWLAIAEKQIIAIAWFSISYIWRPCVSSVHHQLPGINIQEVEDNKSRGFFDQIQGRVTVITEIFEYKKNKQVNL